MTRPLHVALIAASSAHRKRSLREFQAIGLTEGQPKVLAHLLSEEGMMQKELANRCRVEPATMTWLLRKLEEAGHIRKEEVRVSGGKRAYRIYLTDEGREVGRRAMNIITSLEEESYRGFSDEEKEQLLRLLKRVEENVSG